MRNCRLSAGNLSVSAAAVAALSLTGVVCSRNCNSQAACNSLSVAAAAAVVVDVIIVCASHTYDSKSSEPAPAVSAAAGSENFSLNFDLSAPQFGHLKSSAKNLNSLPGAMYIV